MRTAQVALYDEQGRCFWHGPLLTFLHDNAMDSWDASRVIAQLRASMAEGHPPEPVPFGGGAGPITDIHLLEPVENYRLPLEEG